MAQEPSTHAHSHPPTHTHTQEQRRHSPAAERNAPFILTELQRLLPTHGVLLEIASGTGQHAAHCSVGLPHWTWQPSDADPGALASIAAWCAALPRVRAPLHLDLLAPTRSAEAPETVDALYCANLLHIAPWACTAALMQLAARCLAPQGLLITYGPYLEDGVATAPSNVEFDVDLRSRDPAWGLRRLQAVADEALRCGLRLRERVAMPANNLLLVWVRAS